MRMGTFCRIVRNYERFTLRKFSDAINMPHSSISALENGWLPPSTLSLTSLQNHLSVFTPHEIYPIISKFLNSIFLKEYAFRLYADNPFCPISWCSIGVLNAFLDLNHEIYNKENILWYGDFANRILPDYLLDSTASESELESTIYSYLYSLIIDDLQKKSELQIETKFKLIVLLSKKMDFIKPEDTRHVLLTKPTPKIQKILGSIQYFPIISKQPQYFIRFLDMIKTNPPTHIPNAFSALDILLLLSEKIELNPLNPGEITVYLTTHSQKKKRVISYYPPSINIFGFEFSEPKLKIEEIH